MAPGRDWTHQVGAADRAGSTVPSVRRSPRDPPVAQSTARTALPPGRSDLQARLTGELELFRQCREWLERLDRGERVVVNLRPWDRSVPVPSRSTAPPRSGCWPGSSPTSWLLPADRRRERSQGRGRLGPAARHRQRLAAREPPPKRLTMREERAMLRALLDLPPSEQG